MTQKVSSNSIVSLDTSKLTGPHSNATDGSNLTNINDGMIESASDPTTSSNPHSGLGTLWINHTSGEMYCCTDATTNANVWTNVGAGTEDVINQGPTNATNTANFADMNQNASQNFTFSGATDPDAGDTVTHYMVDQISNAVLTVSAAEVAAGSPHAFSAGGVSSDTAVTFRVRAKDDKGNYSSGVTVSMTVLNVVYTTATGGVVNGGTIDGDYKYHVFNSSGTFTVSQAGTDATIDYLVVAGGGSGNNGNPGGGGGAGGFRTTLGTSGRNSSAETKPTISATSYTITVGAGGAYGAGGTNSYSRPGNNSTIAGLSITSFGGGYAGALSNSHIQDGGPGGCGGGAAAYYYHGTTQYGGTGTAGQGYDGGNAAAVGFNAGGGGGAGGVGGSGTNSSASGAGGVGLANSITGSSVFYSGGGGGGGYPAGAGAGGNGGGGAGAVDGGTSTAGTNNTGGGGGGAGYVGNSGGSGIVIVRYKFQN